MGPARASLLLIACVSLPMLALGTAAAQPQIADVRTPRPPPALFVEGTAERVGLRRVAIEASIVGHLARTTMTLTFGNTTGRQMAGDLYVPLPPEATVCGYALDVAGRMVEGVVVKKDEARRIFEKEVRKGVDPGLVEWTRGNVFKTRVFPIPPNGSRTVRLTWVAPLDPGPAGPVYPLPLAFADELDELSVRVEVMRGKERPVVTGVGPLALAFDERLVAESRVTSRAVVQDLRITVPDVASRPVSAERAADGRVYFTVHEGAPPPSDLPRITPRRVRVLWDASLSRESSDRPRELGLLKKYLAPLSCEVELVVVRNEASAPMTWQMPGDIERLIDHLAALHNDGGTQLARLSPPPGARAVDLVLVFSDGLSTFGDDTPASLGAPSWVISSGTVFAPDVLARLAADNGGVHLDLGRTSDETALARIGRPVWSLLSVAIEAGAAREVLPDAPEPPGRRASSRGCSTRSARR